MLRRTLINSNIRVCAIALCSTLVVSTALAVEFPTGTYAAEGVPFTVSFDGNGQFHVKNGPTLEVAGTYSVKAGEIKLNDARGPWACTKPGEQTGTYSWTYQNAVLTFTKVADKCEDRVNSLVKPAWKQQK